MANDVPKFDDTEEIVDAPSFEDTMDIEEEQGPEVSQAGAALKGAQQGLTMGFSDELGAGMQAGMEQAHIGARGLQDLYNEYIAAKTGLPEADMIGKPATQISKELAEEGMTGDIGPISPEEVYGTALEEEREMLQAAEEQHPGTFMAGDIGASFLIPGGAAAKAGTKAAKAAKTAAIGAGVGGVEAAGRTEADLLSEEGLTDVGLGAAGGGILGGLFGKLGQKGDKAKLTEKAKKLEGESNIAALKSIGAKAKDIKEELGTKTNKRATLDTAKGSGKTLMDEDVLKLGQDSDQVKQAIVDKLDEVGSQRIEPAAKKLDELSSEIPLENFSDDINSFTQKIDEDIEKVASGQEYGRTADKGMYSDMDNARQKLLEDVDVALGSQNKIEELVGIRRKLQNQVNWNDPQATSYNEFLVKMQSNLNEMINGMSKKIDPELGNQMIEGNKTYSNLIQANKIAGDEQARELAKEGGLSFRDYLASGVISAATKVPGAGPAVVAGKKAIEKVSGKDTGKLLNTFEAFQKGKKAAKLREQAEKGIEEGIDPTTKTVRGVGASAAAIDEQESKNPYQVQKQAAKYAETASPEELSEAANNIREQYGDNGETLASTLEKISERDLQGRRALIFSLLQDPRNRKMLGLTKEENVE